MKFYNIEDCPFKQIYIDVTTRCQLHCKNCYAAKRNTPDITPDYFEKVCKLFPNKIVWRFCGGEPTLNPYFFDLVKIAHKYRHLATLITNGKKLADIDYCRKIKMSKLHTVAISFDGGIENDDTYIQTQGELCVDFKLKALKNLVEVGFRRISICVLVLRGINEFAIEHLLRLKNQYPKNIRYIHLRNLSPVGIYMKDSKPYTLQELKELLGEHVDLFTAKNKPLFGPCETCKFDCKFNDCYCNDCDRFIIDNCEYSLINFFPESCKVRGQLLPNFRVVPAFEYQRFENIKQE